MTDYRDYLTSVPGVALVDEGGIVNRVIIRGLATAADIEPGGATVVTYFDEIALGAGRGPINIEPLDLARVEVAVFGQVDWHFAERWRVICELSPNGAAAPSDRGA